MRLSSHLPAVPDRPPLDGRALRGTILNVIRLILLNSVLMLQLANMASAEPRFPALTGRVIDEAGLLSANDVIELNATLADLESKSSDQIVVYTTSSLQGYPIEEFAYRLGRHWGIGQAPIDNGILLIVAPIERQIRIEVGRGLEPQMTDLLSKLIIENAILPGFRRGDFPGGIKAGVRDIKDVLLGDTEAVEQRARHISTRSTGNDDIVPFLFFLAILIMFLYVARNQNGTMGNPANPQSRRSGGRVIVIPGGWGGSGTWRGGRSGGGGWSGGGGGSFGGGGATGRW